MALREDVVAHVTLLFWSLSGKRRIQGSSWKLREEVGRQSILRNRSYDKGARDIGTAPLLSPPYLGRAKG